MSRLAKLGAYVLAALAILAPAADAQTIPPSRVKDIVCVNLGNRPKASITDAELQLMQNAGINYLRFAIDWNVLEIQQGSYRWELYDPFIVRMRTYGIKPITILCYNNPLYESNPRGVVTEAGRTAFATYARACVEHYSSDPDHIFEIWNEADSQPFWGQAGQWGQYMDLVDAVVPGMRAENPNVTIVAGSVTQLNTWSNSIDFLNGCFSRGLLTKVDGICFHNYGGGLNNYVERLHDEVLHLRQMITAHGGAANFPLFATEFGTSYLGFPGTLAQQLNAHAECLVRYYLMCLESKFAMATWYEWSQTDSPGYGVVEGAAATPRPAYHGLTTMTAQLNGYEFERRIPVPNSPRDYLFVFRNGTQRKIAAWTSDEGATKTVPIGITGTATGTLPVVQMLGTAGTLTVANNQVTVTATTSPRYINLGTRDVVVPPQPVNLAVNGVITGYSTQGAGTPASNMINGIDFIDADRWSSAIPGYPQWIEVDLGSNKMIVGTELVTYARRAYRFRVEAKPDGGAYQTIVDRTANVEPGPLQNSVTPISARYVKLTVTGAHNYTGNYVSLREFKVFGPAASGGAPINFNSQTITGYSNQDAGTYTILDGGATLRLNGNTWKKIALPYTVTSQTILEFDFLTTQQGEVHGIGFDNDNNQGTDSNWLFQVYGTQTVGNQAFRNYSGTTWKHYVIPVGQYYTGSMAQLVFANDHDVTGSTSNGSFRNVTLSEGGTTPMEIVLEAENLVFTTSDSVTSFSDAAASAGNADKLNATAANDYVEYTAPIPSTGTYTVKIRYKSHPTRGQLQLAVDGNNVGNVLDQYSAGEAWIETELGPVNITSTNDHAFRFNVIGKNVSSGGYNLTFDYIKLVK